ncbi:MAG: GNAT family N-acetyltransferase [Acidimicrobiales bacterium]|nr:GNAT family N-acetyltransferase [Acidimicrobiales bacterium]
MNNLPEITDNQDLVAKILTEAFTGDPFFTWLFPGETHVESLQTWWEYMSQQSRLSPLSELWVMPDQSSGALWKAPHGSTEDSQDVEPFIELMKGLVGLRLEEVLIVFSEATAAHPNEPHWYLQAVGTRSDMQGRGRGADLLKPVLNYCDQQGLGAYLESSNPRNISFYYRLGFVTTNELSLAGGEAALTCMWRSPQDAQLG